MTIWPVFRRELEWSARRESIVRGRSIFALLMLVPATGFVYAPLVLARRQVPVTHEMLARLSERLFLGATIIHAVATLIAGLATAALCIAREKDARTMDFLLATRLSNAEIVLAKYAACLVRLAGILAAGLPIMLVASQLGGIDPGLVALAYAGIGTVALLVASMSIWASVVGRNGRAASTLAALTTLSWLFIPFSVAYLVPRLGIGLPRWIRVPNAWILSSTPVGLAIEARSMSTPSDLLGRMGWMCGLQSAAAVLFLAAAVLQLRSAYRSEDGGSGMRAGGFARGHRPRPEVGDDPIVWKDRYTCRPRGLAWLIDRAANGLVAVAILAATGYFALPALGEVVRHGYTSGASGEVRPEFNLFTRFFLPIGGGLSVSDAARMDLNIFLRFASTAMMLILVCAGPAAAAEGLIRERMGQTWSSLLATPLDAREFVTSRIRVVLYRWRGAFVILAVLWIVGLITGAVHPLGLALGLIGLVATIASQFSLGVCMATLAGQEPRPAGAGMGFSFLLAGSGLFPFALPPPANTILIGAASPPLMMWLTLLSYREVGLFRGVPVYPHLKWLGIETEEGLGSMLILWLACTLIQAAIAFLSFRYAITRFDRLMDRPYRPPSDPRDDGIVRSDGS